MLGRLILLLTLTRPSHVWGRGGASSFGMHARQTRIVAGAIWSAPCVDRSIRFVRSAGSLSSKGIAQPAWDFLFNSRAIAKRVMATRVGFTMRTSIFGLCTGCR